MDGLASGRTGQEAEASLSVPRSLLSPPGHESRRGVVGGSKTGPKGSKRRGELTPDDEEVEETRVGGMQLKTTPSRPT